MDNLHLLLLTKILILKILFFSGQIIYCAFIVNSTFLLFFHSFDLTRIQHLLYNLTDDRFGFKFSFEMAIFRKKELSNEGFFEGQAAD